MQGRGIGSQVVNEAKDLSDQTGLAHSWVKVTNPFFDQFDHLAAQHDPRTGRSAYSYTPSGATTARVAARTCPTCGDPLKGEYGTYCPRCSWSENDANLDHDPLSNPPDPTVDMHRGIQARIVPSHRWAKWFEAVEDLA